MMLGDRAQNAAQRPGLDRPEPWHHLMVLAMHLRRHPNVRARLPSRRIAQHTQRFDQLIRIDIARSLHTAKTSSRTKCSRMICGASAGSSK